MTDQGAGGGWHENDLGMLLEARLLRASVGARLFGEQAATPVCLGPYRLQKQIGAGGMGVVFEACDSRTGHRLAIKVLRRHGATELALLKREFRVMADLHHPNLVQLYELSVEDEHTILAMELIEGTSLLSYVRPDGALDCDRLWHALRQLVDAISTLHAAGVLHRDLKPSNVLVQPDKRLVVLDFGLALAVGEQRSGQLSGTPRYMAPEQWRGQPASPASDWYSVGVMLLEALLGESAIAEVTLQSGAAALLRDAQPTRDTAEIRRITAELLHADPACRPGETELRLALGLSDKPRPASPIRPIGSIGLLIGREDELVRLRESMSQAIGGRCVRVHVSGEPGIGKTALVKRFIAELRARSETTILEGRCYEGEFVPFNVADGLVEALALELEQLPETDRRLPDGSAELLRLFPALRRLSRGEPLDAEPASADPLVVRQRAFAALRSLLQTLAARRPLVLHIDDLQWGDADSAQLLYELLRSPAPTPMLVVASYRSGGAELSECVRAFRELGDGEDVHELALKPLEHEASLALARALASGGASEQQLERVSAEAAGNPLFLRALVEHCLHPSSPGEAGRHGSFQDVLQLALQQLPSASQELLQLVALSTRPIERELLLRAVGSELGVTSPAEQLAQLQRTGLLRSVPGRRGAFEAYHDRVREGVAALIAPEAKRRHHARLAAAEAASAGCDPEFLAYHYEAAGQLAAAAQYAELAGDRALQAAALESAAKHYEAALRCLGGGRPAPLVRKLADAIAYTGRCAHAVPQYLEAAHALSGQDALELRLRAAEMLLRSGRLPEGVEAAKPLLRAVGLRYPASTFGALASVFVNMQRLRMRDLESVAARREPTTVERLQADVCFVLGYRLSIVDPLRACALLARSLLLALDSGSDAQLARALAAYAVLLGTLGKGSTADQDRLHERAWELACERGDADVKGWVLFFRVLTCYARGDFHDSLQAIERARSWIAVHCVDTGWMLQELDTGTTAQLYITGRIAAVAELAPVALRRMKDSGNGFLAQHMEMHWCFVHLARDQPSRAMEAIEHVLRQWSPLDFYMPVAIALAAKAHALIYVGDERGAWQLVSENWPRFIKAGYHRAQPWNILCPLIESSAALASAQREPSRRSLRAVQRGIATLGKQTSAWALPSRRLVEAGLRQLWGDRGAAARLYADAADGFEALEMSGYAAAAQVRCAALVSEAEAAERRARAEAWFRAEGIVAPERWIRIYAPVDPLI